MSGAEGSRIVVVGEAPDRRGSSPMLGLSGGRLATLAGMTTEAWARDVLRLNLLDANPGLVAAGRSGDRWVATTEARLAADRLTLQLDGRRVVLLGRRVAAAFGVRGELLRWLGRHALRPSPASDFRRYDDAPSSAPSLAATEDTAIVPHPSGASRWWNRPENRLAAEGFMRDAMRSPRSPVAAEALRHYHSPMPTRRGTAEP